MSTELPTGGTTVGLKLGDGIVLASEKRLAYGYTILSKSVKKVYQVNERIGLAFAGLIGDMQALVKKLSYYVNLYEMENSSQISVKSAAKLLSVLLYDSRFTPYFTDTIVGGRDETGFHLFTLDALGSLLEEDYVSIGKGAPIALGILESEYNSAMDLKTGAELAKKSITQAAMRDITSGDGIDILIIDAHSVRFESYALRSSTRIGTKAADS